MLSLRIAQLPAELAPEHSVWTAALSPSLARSLADDLLELSHLPKMPCLTPVPGLNLLDGVVHLVGFSAGSLSALSIERLLRSR